MLKLVFCFVDPFVGLFVSVYHMCVCVCVCVCVSEWVIECTRLMGALVKGLLENSETRL